MAIIQTAEHLLLGKRRARQDFEQRFSRHLNSGDHQAGDGESLTEAFLATGGTALTAASERCAQAEGQYDFSRAHDVLGLWQEPGSFAETLGQIQRDGYAVIPDAISPELAGELSATFAATPCHLTSDSFASGSSDYDTVVDFENPAAEKYAIPGRRLLHMPRVRELLLDRGLLQMAQAYIGSVPIVDIVTAWYSFPSAKPSHQAAQLFHFDLDRIKWLKVFFLLTDQNERNGAHVFIPGTHRDGGIGKALLKRGYARLEDQDVAAVHPRSTWKTMEGKAGTILFEDTRGLHKGTNLLEGYRLMLQFEYCQSLFGHPADILGAKQDAYDDPHWAAMESTYPRVFDAIS